MLCFRLSQTSVTIGLLVRMIVGTFIERNLQCRGRAHSVMHRASTFKNVGLLLLLTQISGLFATQIGNSILGGTGSMMPTVVELDVKCGRSGMNVNVIFDRPFPGIIYSKGHYYEERCHYVTEKNSNSDHFRFFIPNDACGTTGVFDDPTPDQDMYFENTIIIQNDPLIQEIWDEARNVRCTWQHTISKTVETKSISVVEPEKVKVDFDSRSINTVMQIQQGNFPLFSAPATGYVYAGQDASVVIYLQDSSHNLDANVVSCEAYSNTNKAVELIDANGCLKRPEMMTSFAKLHNPEGVQASMLMYANLKGLKVDPKDPSFRISCQLEVCEGRCLEPCALGESSGYRFRRQVSTTELIQLHGGAIVVAKERQSEVNYCSMSTYVATTVVLLVFMCAILCCISCYLALKLQSLKDQLSQYIKC